MSKKKTSQNEEVAPEDSDLFREMIGDVKPIVDSGRVSLEKTKPTPKPRFSLQDDALVASELLTHEIDPGELETGEHLSYLRVGLQQQILRKLRRGVYSVGRVLDLHGLTAVEAHQAVNEFLNQVDARCVRIIHGKGNSSVHGPVLKRKLGAWLRRRNDVLAYCSARPHDGGTGAVYVLLKAR